MHGQALHFLGAAQEASLSYLAHSQLHSNLLLSRQPHLKHGDEAHGETPPSRGYECTDAQESTSSSQTAECAARRLLGRAEATSSRVSPRGPQTARQGG